MHLRIGEGLYWLGFPESLQHPDTSARSLWFFWPAPANGRKNSQPDLELQRQAPSSSLELEDILPERNHLMRAFLLLFLLFPVLELYVFFKVSTAIGFFPALLLIIAGSMLGDTCGAGRRIGDGTQRARKFESRRVACRANAPRFDAGVGRWLAGAARLYQRHAAGLLLLFPPVRRFLVNRLRKRAEEQAIRQRAFAEDFEAARPRSHQPLGREPNVIEGEFEHRDK
jgi:UPF0716 protein FxsA